MQQRDPFELTATEISQRVRSGDWLASEVADFYIRRIENLQPTLNTHIHWDQDRARSSVESQLDYLAAAQKAKVSLPLAGVPIAVKDNILVKGEPATCASKILTHFQAPYDATVIAKLRQAGAIVLGKTNLDEFAMGSSNENSAYGPVYNPWNTRCVPGGSSGGSAAATAAAMTPLALGSDTGGSIRQPASFCGVVGLKPTYGRVSRYGLVAFASSFDQIGPFGRTVEDTALLYDAISGHDEHDATCLRASAVSAIEAIKAMKGRDLKGMTIGVIDDFVHSPDLDPDVSQAMQTALQDLEHMGATLQSVSLPSAEFGVAAYYIIATAEASSNLSRFDGVRYGYRSQSSGPSLKDMYVSSRSEGFGQEVKQRIMLGTFALSSGYYDAYYAKAGKVRRLLAHEMDQALAGVDLLLSPTAPSGAFEIGAKAQDPLAMYLSDVFTIHANLGGYPAISIPCGFDRNGLPVGLQLIAPRQREDLLFQGSYVYEQAKRWNDEFKPRC
jgi:aspartyl-tRNA(Asn)/glutamyl-tRNA(Gln) amidotransferase subunit A